MGEECEENGGRGGREGRGENKERLRKWLNKGSPAISQRGGSVRNVGGESLREVGVEGNKGCKGGGRWNAMGREGKRGCVE